MAKICGVEVGVVFTDLKGHIYSYRSSNDVKFGLSDQLLNKPTPSGGKREFFQYQDKDVS